MKIIRFAIVGLLVSVGTALAIDLADVPNESSFANAKGIINSNNVLIEAAIPVNTLDLAAAIVTNAAQTVSIAALTAKDVNAKTAIITNGIGLAPGATNIIFYYEGRVTNIVTR